MIPTPSHVPAYVPPAIDAHVPVPALERVPDAVPADAQAAFLSQVAHELRTPLTTLNAALGLMRRRIDVPEADPLVVHLFGLARSGTERLMGLVEDWLDVAAMDAGSFQLARTEVAPLALAQGAIERLRAAAERRAVSVVVGGTARAVPADRARLERVLVHLLDRALAVAPAGGVVTLRLEDVDVPAAVRLTLEHDGVLSPAEPADGVAGLGLALCRAVVARHGGELAVTADAARTRCTIVLPVA